jgi:hypothetical protein
MDELAFGAGRYSNFFPSLFFSCELIAAHPIATLATTLQTGQMRRGGTMLVYQHLTQRVHSR